jgi:hypothetical protein
LKFPFESSPVLNRWLGYISSFSVGEHRKAFDIDYFLPDALRTPLVGPP